MNQSSLLEALHEGLELVEAQSGKLLLEVLLEATVEIQKLRVLNLHLLHHLV
jgi:hypothetical protein